MKDKQDILKMKNIKNHNNFVGINNEFLTETNRYHLTPNELCTFVLLSIERNYQNKVHITVKSLAAFSPIKLLSNDKMNLNEYKKSLIALRDKGAIYLVNEHGEVNDTFSVNDPLQISIIDIWSEVDTGGYTKVEFNEFYQFECADMLMIYLACNRWNGSFTCSLTRWQKILARSRPTVIKQLDKAISSGYIAKIEGAYNEKNKQETNVYTALPFAKVENEPMIEVVGNESETLHDAPAADKVTESETTNLQFFSVEKLKESLKRFTTFKDEMSNDVFPIEADYIAYMDLRNLDNKRTPFDNEVFEAAEKRIRALKNNETSALILMKNIELAKMARASRDELEGIITANKRESIHLKATEKIYELNQALGIVEY